MNSHVMSTPQKTPQKEENSVVRHAIINMSHNYHSKKYRIGFISKQNTFQRFAKTNRTTYQPHLTIKPPVNIMYSR